MEIELPVYSLEELVAGVTDENKPDSRELDFGPPVGLEVW